MRILGLNKSIRNLYIVYITVNRNHYFVGAYLTEEKAIQVANKNNGKIVKV